MKGNEMTDGQTDSEQSSIPAVWRVVDQRLGAVDALLLGDQRDDSFRISITIAGLVAPDVEARAVYPCRVCGWEFACGPSGEDCHS